MKTVNDIVEHLIREADKMAKEGLRVKSLKVSVEEYTKLMSSIKHQEERLHTLSMPTSRDYNSLLFYHEAMKQWRERGEQMRQRHQQDTMELYTAQGPVRIEKRG